MRLIPLGDSAVTLQLDRADRALAVAQFLKQMSLPGVIDVLAAFEGVTIYYDSCQLVESYSSFCRSLAEIARESSETSDLARVSVPVEVPICYAGPDLIEVAHTAGLTESEVIELHQSVDYTVLAVGFLPGFAYLGGLPEILRTPRRRTPRTLVPAGSVGLGGMYTGIYPFASPGGWNIIGQTNLQLFDPTRSPPALLQVGQRVRFISGG